MADTMTITSIVTPTIAVEILAEHEAAHAAARSALAHARRAGALLIEAKQNVSHGEWLPWVAAHLPTIAPTTVTGYMRVASRWGELQTGNGVADLPLRDALKMLAEPRERKAPANIEQNDSYTPDMPSTTKLAHLQWAPVLTDRDDEAVRDSRR